MVSRYLSKCLFLWAFAVSATATAQTHQEGQHNDDATAHHRFTDTEKWADRFENSARDAWQLPDSVVATLAVRDDLVIVDIGSATGYFPVRFARACPAGRVIGADIESEMVWYLNERSRREGLPNLVSILAAPNDPHLPMHVDLVFLCNTYHHIDNRIDYFTRLKDQMRSGGRVAVVDFRPSSDRGPPHKLAPDVVESEMSAAGYALVESHDFLPDQYFLVFEDEAGGNAAAEKRSADLDARVKKVLDSNRWGRGDMNVPAVDGQTMYDIIIDNRYTQALEIGTSTGHSTIWIAWALSKTGGKLITLEIDERRHREALENFEEAGLSEFVDARLGDAHKIVPSLEGPFDFVFSDADKNWYKNYLVALLPKLAVGGCYASHNVSERGRSRGGWVSEYLDFLFSLPDVETTIDERGGGLSLSYKKPE
ncbi:MAG: class I SAM-dependent methyltransferase [Candidatus Krumholzibacteria bacterium]|nr:class I SAM-dependent methyltransferase [Candidatus Krumholzibacteria bacterium]